nr:hypothetical protein [Tanacetum cinerariifolium]
MSAYVLCVGCGTPLYGFLPCQWCTCEQCGNDLRDGFCSLCNSRNSCVYDPNPNTFDCPPGSYLLPHPTYETYSGDSCGNYSNFGHDCPPQFSLNYEPEPGYIENYKSYPYDSSSFPQQYPCCTRCGGPHVTCQCDQLIFDEPHCKNCEGPHMNFQCQPMNQNFYNSNSSSFDQSQPPQSLVVHQPPQEMSVQEMEDLKQQYFDKMKQKLLQLEQLANLSTYPSKRLNSFCYDDDDEDYTIAITPVLSTGEPDNSLNQFEDFFESNNEFSSTDDDSFSIDNIDYVEASLLDSELVSSEVMEIVILEVGGIDDDILLTIKDDILREKLLNVNLLISKIEALNDNPTPSSDCKTKSPSTSLNSLLEETNASDNSLPEFETSALMWKRLVVAVPLLILIILFQNMKFSMTIMSDFYEFIDELIPFIYPPEYDSFLFKVEPNSRDFTKDLVEDISPTKEPQVHNALPTHPNLQLNIKFQPSSEYLFTYVVRIFLPFLVYSVALAIFYP